MQDWRLKQMDDDTLEVQYYDGTDWVKKGGFVL